MNRLVKTGSLCLFGLVGLNGCTSFFTARAIESFTAGLQSEDLDRLRTTTSEEFEQKALRLSNSVEALKVLSLPTDESKVQQIEELGPDERLVTVAIGEDQRPIQYRLKREAASNGRSRKWVVDDVILVQERPGRDTPLTKSVTEQMDVLLTVQELLIHLRDGTREEVQSILHPALQAKLADISPAHLAQLTKQVTDGVVTDSFKPEAHIQSDRAAVFLPRRTGQFIVELQRLDGNSGEWRVSELAVRERKNERPKLSLTQTADRLGVASKFLRGYDAGDREALSQTATEAFYKQALMSADLDGCPLPTEKILATKFEFAESEKQSDLLFDLGDMTCLVSIATDNAPAAVEPGKKSSPQPLRVQEVTIYEANGSQIKPLSSVLTSQAIVEVFSEALAKRDVTLLRQLSTTDLDNRVWSRLSDPALIEHLPFDGIPDSPPHVVTTIFQGPVTEITVTQGTRALTYVLHNTRGRPKVDDILIPSNNRPSSLKTVLESLAPIYNFALAWDDRKRDVLERESSDSLRRKVWSQMRELPDLRFTLQPFVQMPLRSIAETSNDRLVKLGDDRRGAVVRLVSRGSTYVVEDVQLYGKEFVDGQMTLSAALREQIIVGRFDRRSPLSMPEKSRSSEPASDPLPSIDRNDFAAHNDFAPAADREAGSTKPLLLQSVAIPGA